MITTSNLKNLLNKIGFEETSNGVFIKQYPHFEFSELKVDFNEQKITYPELIKVYDTTSSGNFSHSENFVVLECITRLMDKGYRPNHIEIEKRWQLGHGASGGKADICVSNETGDEMLFIVECKTAGQEYNKALKDTKIDGGQLFSYWQQERSTKWLVLYASDFKDDEVVYYNEIIKCSDDANILKMAEKDNTQLTYKKAYTVQELVEVWKETYQEATYDNLIFGNDTQAYKIGIRPLLKADLRDFTPDDKIVNRFEEILRHNNVSDRENAFNRLIALFICKLVDEIKKNDFDEVEFQYRVGTDTYESLQDRLQRLHKIGMEEFMQEEINYVDDEYADRVFAQLSQSKRKSAIENLRNTIRILKYYTNNDFTFKDVHNEELFYQNGKILVEVVQLFEKYRIVYSAKHQFLGDLFEQLLNKGFKQNEGQFFTPMPITRFIWDSLPLDKILHSGSGGYRLPKIIDYACGAGHFLTEAVEAINEYMCSKGCAEQVEDNRWVEKCIYGVEKDYRLARVAKVSLHMNGAGKGQIIFGDGLEQYVEKGIVNGTFDILVANPPYSVDAFKAHLKLKNNSFEILPLITNTGDSIETLFVERISQLLRPTGIAAVVLPSSILSNDSGSYIAAREQILQNFFVRAISQFGSKTFGATGTNTVVLFLEKYNEPPKRKEYINDSVEAILSNNVSAEWEDKAIFDAYLQRISVSESDYVKFLSKELQFEQMQEISYFKECIEIFNVSAQLKALVSKKSYKSLTPSFQEKEKLDLFYKQQFISERDKLYYFALVYKQNTLIITAPQSNDEQKRFLGYDWSNRRGSEGIQINSPGGMLYNAENRFSAGTLAAAVRHSYNDLQPQIPERQEYYTFARLQDMIEFARPVFNKAIKTSVDKQIVIRSKYPLVKLGTIAEIVKGKSITKAETIEGDVKVVAGGLDYAYLHNEANREANIITISASGANAGFVNYWDEPIFASDCTTVKGKSDIETLFLYNFLQSIQEQIYYLQRGSGQPHVYPADISSLQIPQISESLMIQIVSECQKVDEEYNASRMTIEEYRNKIRQVFESLDVIGGGKSLRLSDKDVFEVSIGKRVLNSEVGPEYEIPVYSANVFEPFGMINKELITDFSKDSVIWGIDGDWMVNVLPANYKFYPTDHCGVLRIKTDDVLPKYMAYLLNKEGERIGFKRSYRASIDRIENLTVKIAPIEAQRKAVNQVEEYEAEIQKAQVIMAQCANKKKAILDKYLN